MSGPSRLEWSRTTGTSHSESSGPSGPPEGGDYYTDHSLDSVPAKVGPLAQTTRPAPLTQGDRVLKLQRVVELLVGHRVELYVITEGRPCYQAMFHLDHGDPTFGSWYLRSRQQRHATPEDALIHYALSWAGWCRKADAVKGPARDR